MIAIISATPAHAAAIAEIYNHAVVHTTAIWNDAQVDADNRAQFIATRHSAGFPFLVAVDEFGVVKGYASYGDFRAFAGYRFTVEHSVYVHHDARRQGIAKMLLNALIAHARGSGKHIMVGAIEKNNLASIALHLQHGFVDVGCLPEVGFKFGRWLDLSFLQLKL